MASLTVPVSIFGAAEELAVLLASEVLLLAMHLTCKQCLLNADVATCRVIRLEAVQETAVPFPLAVAIARLLHQDLRHFFRSLICLPHISTLKARRLECCWKGHRILRAVVIHRHRCESWLGVRRRFVEYLVCHAREQPDHRSAEENNPPVH